MSYSLADHDRGEILIWCVMVQYFPALFRLVMGSTNTAAICNKSTAALKAKPCVMASSATYSCYLFGGDVTCYPCLFCCWFTDTHRGTENADSITGQQGRSINFTLPAKTPECVCLYAGTDKALAVCFTCSGLVGLTGVAEFHCLISS